MTRRDWDKLSESARRKAFMISHTGNMDVINQVWKAIDKAQAKGTSLSDFRKALVPTLKQAWGGDVNNPGAVANPAWRIETIYRTNLQMAYSAGRWAQQTAPAVLKVRPFWMLDVILDNRTSGVCNPLAGTVLPASDEFWLTHCPPLHFNCRSAIRSLRESQAKEKEGFGKPAPSFNPQKGFGLSPDASEWKPDLSKYPPELRGQLEARLKELDKLKPVDPPEGAKIAAPAKQPKVKAAKPPPAAPAVKPEHTDAHWLQTYAHLGSAAEQAAAGRAAFERGLDQTLEEAKVKLGKDFPGTWPVLDYALKYSKKGATIREASGSVLSSKRSNLEACAALVGHLDTVAGGHAPIKVKVLGLPVKKNPNRAKDVLDQCKAEVETLRAVLAPTVDAGTPKIKFVSGSRAQQSNGQIRIGGRPGSLVHEWGHEIEERNPEIHKACVAFLNARTVGEAVVSLSKVTGRSGFRRDEVCKQDKFRNPYAGKIYSNPRTGDLWATEILSMGLEWLALDSFSSYAEDSEHFLFLLGLLAGVK